MRLGYDAVALARPLPWVGIADQKSRYATSDDERINGRLTADLRDDEFPIHLRREFFEVDEVVLHGYLDQPLVFFGQASSLASGLDPPRGGGPRDQPAARRPLVPTRQDR
jgi:hypothetical protein